MSSCKKGIHNYGEGQAIGAGILRQVCSTCGDVTIDLTGVEELTETSVMHRPTLANFRR